jgi:NAD(P)-dependent dehydrogenase (short-subunit alcohol dehydrogenase family)
MSKHIGKIAVVTGGTGGLGKVIVRELLKEQVTVIATYSGAVASSKLIEETKKEFPLFSAEIVNAADKAEMDLFFQKIISHYGRVDILVNTVGGISKKDLVEDITELDWNKMMSLNVASALYAMQGVLPIMKKNGFGRIINIAAMTALVPEAMKGSYAVSKSALVTLTKTAAAEVKETKHNITVNAVAPSILSTEENKKWGTPDEIQKWVAPKEIADAIIHLCSDESQSINGNIIQMYGKV